MQPLLKEFTANLAGHVAAIRKAIAADDASALRQICHQLKGSGKSYGFAPISTHADEAGKKIVAGRPLSDVYSDINALLDYIERIEGYRPI